MSKKKELLPLDWCKSKLGELFQIKHGFAFSGDNFCQVMNSKPLLSPGNFRPQGGIKFDWKKQKFYDGEVSKDFVLKKGDLIVAMTDLTKSCIILGAPAIIPDSDLEYLHNQRLGLVENLKIDKLDINYLFHYFNHSVYRNYLRDSATGTTVSHTSPKVIYEVPIALPPLPEQQKIAEILSTVDAKIEVIDQQITETQALKKGLMQRLLTKGIGHTEFKDSPLGEIPKSWEVVTISEIAQIKGRIGYRGYTKEDIVEKGEGAISVSPSNIKNNKLDFSKNTYISWFKYEESPEIQLEKNDILLVKTGSSFGKVAIVKDLIEKATINPQLVIFKTKEYNPHFLYYILADNAVQKQIIATIVGGAIPTLSQKNMLEFEIPQPQIEEQQKISNILNSVDDKLEVLLEKKTHYQELKQGLMQQLLTGKIRVL